MGVAEGPFWMQNGNYENLWFQFPNYNNILYYCRSPYSFTTWAPAYMGEKGTCLVLKTPPVLESYSCSFVVYNYIFHERNASADVFVSDLFVQNVKIVYSHDKESYPYLCYHIIKCPTFKRRKPKYS